MEQVLIEGAEGIRFRIDGRWVEHGKQTLVSNSGMVRRMIKEKTVFIAQKKKKGSK